MQFWPHNKLVDRLYAAQLFFVTPVIKSEKSYLSPDSLSFPERRGFRWQV